jgi:hypothetical protein
MPRIKRKYTSSCPTLGEGIPELKRLVSETGPSIPSEKEHKAVRTVKEKEFGLLGPETFREIEKFSTKLEVIDGCISYVTENDVALTVRSFVSSIVDALGLSDQVKIFTEIGVFKLRPDLWVISLHAMPIGIIEVKKPDLLESETALEHPNVLGELYDFIKHLPNFYGVSPAFGIITNLNSWRIAWLPDEDTEKVAAQEEEIDEEETLGPQESSETLESVDAHQIESDDKDGDDDNDAECATEEDPSGRALNVSKIYHKNDDDNVAVRAIASAILKMYKAKRQRFRDPFQDLSKRSLLKFEKGNNASVFWTRLTLSKGPQWDKVAAPTKFLYAIEDLGYGAHGRVWLTCASSGAVCVLKFALDGKGPLLDSEKEVWEKVYSPEFKAFREDWCGEPALRMPHFAKVKEHDQKHVVPLVKATLMSDYHQKGLVHKDVSWRNIGLYKAKSGELRSVVFDMGSVREVEDGESATWVTDACDKLLV